MLACRIAQRNNLCDAQRDCYAVLKPADITKGISRMRHETSYRNKAGLDFKIEVEDIEARPEIDNWKYQFRVKSVSDGKGRTFHGLMLKTTYPEKSGADVAVMGDPLEYLKHAYLDAYTGDGTDLVWSLGNDGWYVF